MFQSSVNPPCKTSPAPDLLRNSQAVCTQAAFFMPPGRHGVHHVHNLELYQEPHEQTLTNFARCSGSGRC